MEHIYHIEVVLNVNFAYVKTLKIVMAKSPLLLLLLFFFLSFFRYSSIWILGNWNKWQMLEFPFGLLEP